MWEEIPTNHAFQWRPPSLDYWVWLDWCRCCTKNSQPASTSGSDAMVHLVNLKIIQHDWVKITCRDLGRSQEPQGTLEQASASSLVSTVSYQWRAWRLIPMCESYVIIEWSKMIILWPYESCKIKIDATSYITWLLKIS